MAGTGQRFKDAGYAEPKPFIQVKDDIMIKKVISSVGLFGKEYRYHFIMTEECCDYYIKNIAPIETGGGTSSITKVYGKQEGAVHSLSFAKHLLDNDSPLIILNCDGLIYFNTKELQDIIKNEDTDGAILLFKNSHPRFSYAILNESNVIIKVAEKEVISDDATCGLYYWRRGSDFFKYAQQMIDKQIKINNEYYVCPVYNQAIEGGKKIKGLWCDEMYSVGTPEELVDNLSKIR